ncbi:MAG: hypothetical protein LAT68_15415 [Cyclobacteriaceae bacterium]|nr:hypothetical protein [Cyclobacteriaceae bacterium]MCH8517710.1 hypothetical protein [Cyclobacteriaceae bacterium]
MRKERVILLLIPIFFHFVSLAQNNAIEEVFSEEEKKRWQKFDLSNLPYLFDDFILTAGISQGGLTYSDNFRELDNLGGFHFGAELYVPILPMAFASAGIHYSRRGFSHVPDERVDFHL